MATETREAAWMGEALALARKGLGRVSPNPMAGCVLVRSGRVVGRGWHGRFGGPHAEVAALAQAGGQADGATAYVTLEPCGFFGKTPPCTQALVRAGVRRVVAAMADPDPRVNGRGLQQLRAAGLEVSSGLLREAARALNRAYVVHRTLGRPYVILKAAASLDGKLGTPSGESRWITSEAARRQVHRMRGEVDGVLVGINTVLKDDPLLTSHGAGHDPVRVILDSDLRIHGRAKVLKAGGPLTVIATARRSLPRLARLRGDHLCLLQVKQDEGRVDLRDLLRQLGRMGITTLLVEGGSTVHTSFLTARLVDEVRIFIAPKLIGGKGALTLFEGPGPDALSSAIRLRGAQVERIGEDFLFTARVGDGPA